MTNNFNSTLLILEIHDWHLILSYQRIIVLS